MKSSPPDPADIHGMRALSIRQPYDELILRGIKTVELGSRSTKIVRERFYIYACKARATSPCFPCRAAADRRPLRQAQDCVVG